MLIVFLFAAVLAISLYLEMPVVAFEAKRAKEQLLVDRGTEYAHAVKLYYRKFKAYPPSLNALENTNNLRFLRHRFKDPMTGNDEWRLLHAGPGGQLTDSKVNPIGLTANGQTSGSAGGTSNNAFGTSASNAGTSNPSTANAPPSYFAAAPASPDAQQGTAVGPAGLPQRPPEMPVNAQQSAGALPTAADASQAGIQMPNGQQVNSNMPVPGQPGGIPQGVRGAMILQPGATATGQPSGNPGDPSNPMQGVQSLIGNPNPQTPASAPATPSTVATGGTPGAATSQTTSTGSQMGVLNSGGIAGVASLAKGASIKTVNDQQDYSLWEFYYDPTKDTSVISGASGINPMNGTSQPLGVNNSNNNNNNSNNASSSTTASPNSAATPNTSTTPQQQQP